MSETAIMRDVLVAVSAIPGAMFWRNNTGVFRTMDGSRIVRVGLVGAPDIIGTLHGRAVGIECKTLTGEKRIQQDRFRRAWERCGGIYVLARSVAEALAGLPGVLS